jgi:hypothetical protein
MRIQHLRTFALASSGIVFTTIGLLALASPVAVARAYGFTLDRVESFNEFRAVYTGFWLSLGVAMITAARRPDVPILGDVCGVMLFLQASGRILSLALDGRPAPEFLVAMVAEMMGALTILVVPRLRAAAVAS